jgi:aromatic-amino-acid transaminase
VLGQLKATVRRNYSSPPNFAQVVATVLGDTALKASWLAEVERCVRAFWRCVRSW